MFRKSINIRSTPAAQAALEDLLSGGGASSSSSRPAEKQPERPPSPPPRPAPSAASSSSSSSSQPAAASFSSASFTASSSSSKVEAGGFTTEQREAAIRIKSLKDYYQVLGVERTATETELKSAYRKVRVATSPLFCFLLSLHYALLQLALKFHPDKNRAPEAKEAFICTFCKEGGGMGMKVD